MTQAPDRFYTALTYTMLARILALGALLTTLPASAQSSDGAPHAVPAGSEGHRVELTLGLAPGAVPAEALVVQAEGAPPWLLLAPSATAEASDGGELVARFGFGVARTAPVGETAEVRFDVLAGGAVVGTTALAFRVAAPPALALGQPFPNPTRGALAVPFEVPAAGPVRLVVVDVLGREVAVLADGAHEPGGYTGRLPEGALAAGSYVLRLSGAGDAQERLIRRFTVVR